MTGLRIYGQATFAQIFDPVLQLLDGLVWVVAYRDAWRFPPEWEDASSYDPGSGVYRSGPIAEFQRDIRPIDGGDGFISTVDIFPRYAPAVDDGQCIFGLRSSPEIAAEFLDRTFWRKRDYGEAVKEAEVSFIGDESWWEFYTKNDSLLTVLKSHLPRVGEMASRENAASVSAAYEEAHPARDTELYTRLFDAIEKRDC
jgi:hypothetical protein